MVAAMPYAQHIAEKTACCGRGIYEREIRVDVEPGHLGYHLVVSVESGDYEVTNENLEDTEQL